MLKFCRSAAAVFDGVMNIVRRLIAGICHDRHPSFTLVFSEEIDSDADERSGQNSKCEKLSLFHTGLLSLLIWLQLECQTPEAAVFIIYLICLRFAS